MNSIYILLASGALWLPPHALTRRVERPPLAGWSSLPSAATLCRVVRYRLAAVLCALSVHPEDADRVAAALDPVDSELCRVGIPELLVAEPRYSYLATALAVVRRTAPVAAWMADPANAPDADQIRDEAAAAVAQVREDLSRRLRLPVAALTGALDWPVRVVASGAESLGALHAISPRRGESSRAHFVRAVHSIASARMVLADVLRRGDAAPAPHPRLWDPTPDSCLVGRPKPSDLRLAEAAAAPLLPPVAVSDVWVYACVALFCAVARLPVPPRDAVPAPLLAAVLRASPSQLRAVGVTAACRWLAVRWARVLLGVESVSADEVRTRLRAGVHDFRSGVLRRSGVPLGAEAVQSVASAFRAAWSAADRPEVLRGGRELGLYRPVFLVVGGLCSAPGSATHTSVARVHPLALEAARWLLSAPGIGASVAVDAACRAMVSRLPVAVFLPGARTAFHDVVRALRRIAVGAVPSGESAPDEALLAALGLLFARDVGLQLDLRALGEELLVGSREHPAGCLLQREQARLRVHLTTREWHEHET